jgi:23S rRNA (guanosine2251-2'-O)-methyltransferase
MPVTIHGYHAIQELLKKGPVQGVLFYAKRNKKTEELLNLAAAHGLEVNCTTGEELFRLSGTHDHRGVVLVLESLPLEYRDNLKLCLKELQSENALVVLLDGITDPHNLGAILRSCDQFGADLVIIPKRKSAGETQTVLKTSAGASNFVNLTGVPNLRGAVMLLKAEGFWIYGAHMTGKPINEVDLRGRVALILGSEGRGLGSLLQNESDELIAIPARGHIDSFNVSVCAGIILYEIRRQQDWFQRMPG